MTPEQLNQIKIYEAIIPTIPEAKIRKRHQKKLRLFMAQDGDCCICGKAMILRHGGSRGSCATFEHVKLRSDGGTFETSNVPLSHADCNARRGMKDFNEFRDMVAKNGGVLPKRDVNQQTMLWDAAKKGDMGAIEHYVAKRLNLALYILALEEGWREPEGKTVPQLYKQLEKPLNFGA